MASPLLGPRLWRGSTSTTLLGLLIAAICAQAVPTLSSPQRFLRPKGRDVAQRKASLLIRRARLEAPDDDWMSNAARTFDRPGAYNGGYQNLGTRAGVEDEAMGELGDSGRDVDGQLDRNWVRGGSMAYDFRLLDNMNPVAPMDRLHTAVGPDPGSGKYMEPIYVPPYLNPDAFPVTSGKPCKCKAEPGKNIECKCPSEAPTGGGPAPASAGGPSPGAAASPGPAAPAKPDNPFNYKYLKKPQYTWLKEVPVLGSPYEYTLEPADLTYSSGDHWVPVPRGGIVAPADTLPLNRYPVQAMADQIWPLPTSAQEDRIGVKYARYLDQVHDRSKECDTVSDECTVSCRPGDQVMAYFGETVVKATIKATFEGNAATVEYFPNVGETEKTTECKLEASCTIFRHCKRDDETLCGDKMEQDDHHNWAGALKQSYRCPEGTKSCKSIQEVVMANTLTKIPDEKPCKACPPGDAKC